MPCLAFVPATRLNEKAIPDYKEYFHLILQEYDITLAAKKRYTRFQTLLIQLTMGTSKATPDMKTRLSALWLFVMLTYTYGDVVTLMDPVKHGTLQLTESFLLGVYNNTVMQTAEVSMSCPACKKYRC